MVLFSTLLPLPLNISFCHLSCLWLVFYGACYLVLTDVSDISERKINILSYKLTSVSNNFLQLSPTRHVLPGELRRVQSQASVVATYFPTL